MGCRLIVAIAVIACATRASAQEIETETARTLPQGAVKGGAGVELQTSPDGSEVAAPTFIEGGLTDRLELVVEPVPFTTIRPSTGPKATGVGDIEVTLVGLALREAGKLPAIAFAAEVKVPTATKSLIGTGKVDYAAYVILSKRFGDLDVHFNASYTIIGPPPNVMVSNVFGAALCAKYYVGKLDVFAEVLANTAATAEAEMMGASVELAGSELTGTVGAGYKIAPWALVSLGVSIDNNAAVLVHPGVTLVHQMF